MRYTLVFSSKVKAVSHGTSPSGRYGEFTLSRGIKCVIENIESAIMKISNWGSEMVLQICIPGTDGQFFVINFPF